MKLAVFRKAIDPGATVPTIGSSVPGYFSNKLQSENRNANALDAIHSVIFTLQSFDPGS
jgi:hypothetical protein